MVEVASGCLELEEMAMDECALLSDASIAFLVNFDLTHRLRKLSFKGLLQVPMGSRRLLHAASDEEAHGPSGSLYTLNPEP